MVALLSKPGLVPGEWIRPGSIVIDVGINRLPSGKLVGDVEYEAAYQRASWITPVRWRQADDSATLLENTYLLVDNFHSAKSLT